VSVASVQLREYVIDSSILIPYIRRNPAIVARLDALSNQYVTPTIVAELAYGAYRSRDPIDGMQRVEAVIDQLPSVEIDLGIGYDFAEVKNALTRTNQLIPDNDIWIAVAAISYGMTLIARDAHFSRLSPFGLSYQLW